VGFTLLDRPNPNGSHFYPTRNRGLKGIVLHVTAGLEDLDTVDDHSAENTAAYASSTDREVSWHSGSDTDSWVDLLPASYTAWHVIGYNSSTYGHEISKKHTDWRVMSPVWIEKTLRKAAAGLRVKAIENGIPLRRATRAELDWAIANDGEPVGFLTHAELQPQDRRDPGVVSGVDTFPWMDFFHYLLEEGENEPMYQTIELPPYVSRDPEILNEKLITLPWKGGITGIDRVSVNIGTANAEMVFGAVHWQCNDGTNRWTEEFLPKGSTLSPLTDTGGQAAPDYAWGLVVDYAARLGGSLTIEASR
jgi:hypothetical protein